MFLQQLSWNFLQNLMENLPNFQVETLEKKFRDFVITPNMLLAPINRTEPVTGDILPPGPVKWDSNIAHVRSVVKEMRSKLKYETDQLSCELEILSVSNPKEVRF